MRPFLIIAVAAALALPACNCGYKAYECTVGDYRCSQTSYEVCNPVCSDFFTCGTVLGSAWGEVYCSEVEKGIYNRINLMPCGNYPGYALRCVGGELARYPDGGPFVGEEDGLEDGGALLLPDGGFPISCCGTCACTPAT